ncbi:MAG: hypothetical protein AB8B80_10370 [Marinicellaceae bacterium]
MNFKSIRNAIIAPLIATSCLIQADTVTIPNTFTANTPAVASQVNANFDAVKTAVDDNDTRIDDLLLAVAQLQTDLATANSQIAVLNNSLITANSDIDALSAGLFAAVADIDTRFNIIEDNSVLELDGYLMLSTVDGYDTAEFTNINVQINSGAGSTISTVNGLGNLTIGYNETSDFAQEFCSNANYLNENECSNINGHDWGRNVRTGSHNLILGIQNSYTRVGGIVSGQNNVNNAIYSSIVGGRNNRVGSEWSTVTGGNTNIIGPAAAYSSISGGFQNTTFGLYSSVTGGQLNIASNTYSSVSGGRRNTASGENSSITGGFDNTAAGTNASITGGADNTASGESATVSGGEGRNSGGLYDWRAGGLFETD